MSDVALDQRAERGEHGLAARCRRALSFRNASALYVFVVIFVVFSLWVPETFLAATTWRTLLDSQAVTALVAIGLVVPLTAGVFNLAIGSEVGLGSILVAGLLAWRGVPVVPAIALTLVAGATIGLVNGLLVVRAHIDSFIATLGTSSILLALIAWISTSQQIIGLSASFQGIASAELFGVTLPVYALIAVAAIVWYVLERTPVGRRCYATGGNVEAARLAGVNTSAVVIGCFVACGVVTAAAGMLISSRIAAGDPTVGPSYLLPAFTAAFLGSTQFHGGRFNVWGTVVAVYVLATGVKGLQLAGAPVWIPDLFNGVALLIAVGVAKYHVDRGRDGAIARLLRRSRRTPGDRGDAEPTAESHAA